jgi:putative phosphoesterase
MRLAIISDTHLPRGRRAIPEACIERLRAADVIVHAGDFTAAAVLDELEALGPPVVAVRGNGDDDEVGRRLPERAVVDAEGARIAVVHDAGPAKRRVERLRAAFPDCAAVVFGHSHIPLHDDDGLGFQIFNPGSPTDRRRQPSHTMGLADARDGLVRFELLTLD